MRQVADIGHQRIDRQAAFALEVVAKGVDVIVEGRYLSAAVGHAITTIEAVGATPIGRKVQQAWLDLEVVQCGYCQSGQIMAAAALLAKIPSPTDADIDQGMSGNICRCGTYPRIREAIKQAARKQTTAEKKG